MEYTDLDEGRHVFTVRAVDASGNKDASPAKRIWKVDTIKPKAEDFTPEAGSRTSDRTPSVGAVVSDEGRDLSRGDIRLRMDGREIRSFSYDRDTDRLEYVPSGKMDRGVHAVKIMVRDDAGNRAEETWRFEVVKRQD